MIRASDKDSDMFLQHLLHSSIRDQSHLALENNKIIPTQRVVESAVSCGGTSIVGL
jgi:hypothetical protein